MANKLSTRAYAKINLGLRVLKKRRDGYHDIETVFHRINIYDDIIVEEAPVISLATNLRDLPVDDQNLCVRAARLLQEACDVRDGVRITLKKKIPVGAGLGGGSSDAAALLGILPRLWKIPVAPSVLGELALKLGSDVPYFMNDGTAAATGRGEVLHYFPLDIPYWIVLVYPNLLVPTAWAYGETNVQRRGTERPLKDVWIEHMNEPDTLKEHVKNDFEPLVLKTYEIVASVKQGLIDAGAKFALMSGSGSAVFGLFASQSLARTTARAMKTQHQVFVTPPHFHIVSE